MAFIGRGERPSIGNNRSDGESNSDIDNVYYDRYYGNMYYIPLDNTYVLMQMVVTFIILIVGIITFLAVYKSNIIDPIENIKKLFINLYLIIIGLLLTITLIINFFSKSETELKKRLVIISAISIMIMTMFFGIKLNLDATYNEDKFKQIYMEQSIEEKSSSKSKIDIGIGGVSLKTDEEYYIDECVKLYNIFNTKTYGILGVHLLLNILLIYQISKISKIQGKKDRIDKDDLILFDEERDIKI